MATRSKIGVMNTDGTVKGIYCHWDGYPEGVGRMLVQHYNSTELANKLMDLGNLSSIGSEIGHKHSFDHHDPSMCTAYGRDRGEANCEARLYASRREFSVANSWEDYIYLWDADAWLYKAVGDNTRFRSLWPVIAKLKETA